MLTPFKRRPTKKYYKMKARFLTIALFGIMSLSFIACNEEEVVPATDQILTEESTCECEGGIEEREIRD
jgi:hypothetical protein